MGLNVWMIGKTSEDYLEKGISEYRKRLSRHLRIDEYVIPDIKNAASLPPAELKKKEGEALIAKLNSSDFLVLLDERGRQFSSRLFAKWLEERLYLSGIRTVFAIGGAYGWDDSVRERASMMLSLSDMTFSHQLIRLILWEQLYRAVSIQKGLPYHND